MTGAHGSPEHAGHRGAVGDEHLDFRQDKTLWMAENVVLVLHNIYTLRGAPVRNPLRWSKYISEALHKLRRQSGGDVRSHHWPRWGNERIQEVLRAQRDLYANMNNQVPALRQPGGHHQPDPQPLRPCPRVCKSSGTRGVTTARPSTTPAAWSSATSVSGTATRRR